MSDFDSGTFTADLATMGKIDQLIRELDRVRAVNAVLLTAPLFGLNLLHNIADDTDEDSQSGASVLATARATT